MIDLKRHRLLPLLLLAATLSLALAAPLAQAGGRGASMIVSSTKTVAAGATTTTKITVGSVGPFDTMDVSVRADSTYLKATSISVAGSILPAPLVFVNCVDGVGTGCTISDGPGIAHISASSGSGTPTTVTKGLLFTVTWTAKIALTSTNPGSTVTIPCQQLFLAGSQLQGIGIVTSVYGGPPKSSLPGFDVRTNVTSIAIPAGTTHDVTVIADSLNFFAGNVALSASASSSTVTVSLNPTSVSCDCVSQASSQLTIHTTAPGTFTVTVTGAVGHKSTSTTLTVTA